MTRGAPSRATGVHLELSDRPDTRREWLADLVRHREVLLVLARKDFQTRYKRAALGVIWAVLVPLVQAAVMTVVFSRVIPSAGTSDYPVYVFSGVVPYAYFSSVLSAGTTSIVDGTGLTDRVWFPRLVLVAVPVLSNLVALAISVVLLLAMMPIFGVGFAVRTLLILPAAGLLIAFAIALTSVMSALHVYFRDVKFLVQAALMVWMYVTPIVYRIDLLHHLRILVELNPVTGVVSLFHFASVGDVGPVAVPLAVTVGVTVVLLAVGAEVQRRHDRLFVDLL